MSKRKLITKAEVINFDDTPNPATVADIKAASDVIDKKVADLTTAFISKADHETYKTENAAALKLANDSLAVTKAENVKLTERVGASETLLKNLPALTKADAGSLNLTYDNTAKDAVYKTAQDREYIMFNDGSSSDLITKAVTSNINTPGSPTSSLTPYFQLQHLNVFRALGLVLPVGSGESINVPTLNGNGFTKRDDQGTALVDTSTVTNRKIAVQVYEIQKSVPIPAVDALPGLDQAYVGQISELAPVVEMQDMIDTITAASKGAGKIINNVITTKAATALPPADKILGRMLALKGSLTLRYQVGAIFLVSQELMNIIRQAQNDASGSGYAVNPLNNVETLYGKPIMEVDGFADGSSSGDLSAIYGNLKNGLVTVTKTAMNINRFFETSPGRITYYAAFSSKGGITDVNATATMITGA